MGESIESDARIHMTLYPLALDLGEGVAVFAVSERIHRSVRVSDQELWCSPIAESHREFIDPFAAVVSQWLCNSTDKELSINVGNYPHSDILRGIARLSIYSAHPRIDFRPCCNS